MANLDGFRRQLEAKVERVARVVADQVIRELRADAPVDSGRLRSLIEVKVRAVATGAQITIESGASYDIYVAEFREDWDRMLRSLPGRIERAWRALR